LNLRNGTADETALQFLDQLRVIDIVIHAFLVGVIRHQNRLAVDFALEARPGFAVFLVKPDQAAAQFRFEDVGPEQDWRLQFETGKLRWRW
jgi:hypothetical protein